MHDFTLYPAIDLRQGSVVRLRQGDRQRQTRYGDDPGSVASQWLQQGASWLHVVDLDGAFGQGSSANRRALHAILGSGGRVQFGGGLRDMASLAAALGMGVARVVLGTAAVEKPELVRSALERFGPTRVAVGMDLRQGRLQVRGWQEQAETEALDLARALRSMGLETVIVTDVGRDGMGKGLNVELAAGIAREAGLAVIASGGVASLEDIRQAREAGLAGTIVGRALYEGKIDLKEALRC